MKTPIGILNFNTIHKNSETWRELPSRSPENFSALTARRKERNPLRKFFFHHSYFAPRLSHMQEIVFFTNISMDQQREPYEESEKRWPTHTLNKTYSPCFTQKWTNWRKESKPANKKAKLEWSTLPYGFSQRPLTKHTNHRRESVRWYSWAIRQFSKQCRKDLFNFSAERKPRNHMQEFLAQVNSSQRNVRSCFIRRHNSFWSITFNLGKGGKKITALLDHIFFQSTALQTLKNLMM